MQGIVQVFYPLKGFGFIRVGFRDRVFFHISNYQSGIEPVEGMPVSYEIAPPHKPGQREQAVNVVPLATTDKIGSGQAAQSNTEVK